MQPTGPGSPTPATPPGPEPVAETLGTPVAPEPAPSGTTAGDTLGGAGLLQDRGGDRVGAARVQGRIGRSLPTAVAAALLIGTVAFGANLAGVAPAAPTAPDGQATAATAADDTNDGAPPAGDLLARAGDDRGPGGGDRPAVGSGPGALAAAGETSDGEATEPTPAEAEPTPTKADPTLATPEVKRLKIAVALVDRGVAVEWSPCQVDGFLAWKVVRSPDEAISWPPGANDHAIATFEDPRHTRVLDQGARAGHRAFYRVFAFAARADHRFLACASGSAGVFVPKPPEPTPTPSIAPLRLALSLREGHPYLEWSECGAERFSGYAAVRSRDERVTFPAGDGDIVIHTAGPDGRLAFLDAKAPAGKVVYYRVFCFAKTEAGVRVLAASAVRKIETPTPPPPEPIALGFEIAVVEGIPVLHWKACDCDGFRQYRVLRAVGDGEVRTIAEIGDRGRTSYRDETVEAGHRYTYQVLAVGVRGDQKVVLGQTRKITVGIE